MAKIIYKNKKNASIDYIFFEQSCGYHTHVLFKNETDSYLNSCLIDKLVKELETLIFVY